MKIKILIPIILILFLVTSCITVQVDEDGTDIEEEEEGTTIEAGETIEEEEEEPEVEEEETDEEEESDEEQVTSETEHKIRYSETITVNGMSITITEMGSSSDATLDVDGVELELHETRTKEIYTDYYFSMQKYDYVGPTDDSYIILEITPFTLEENEYLLEKAHTLNLFDKDITLEESKSDGYIKVKVCKEGTGQCNTERVKSGDTLEIREINIKNVENFWRDTQYTVIEVTEITS